MKPIMRACLLLTMVTLVSTPSWATISTLAVPKRGQEQSNWCWAACTSAILSYYGKEVEQGHIATEACRRHTWCGFCNCWTDPGNTTCCNKTNAMHATSGSMKDLFSRWGLKTWALPTTLSWNSVKTEIVTDKQPFVIRWGWDTGGGHFIVGRGVNDNEGYSDVYYMNPLPVGQGEYRIGDYSWMVDGDNHEWTHTLKMATAYPYNVYMVNPGSGGSPPTIQAAIEVCVDMDQIELADGIYDVRTHRGSQPLNMDTKGKSVTIRSASGDPNACIIDGYQSCRAFGMHSGENPGTIIKDITFRNGNTGDGAAMVFSYDTAPTITNCVFMNHTSSQNGGAIACQNYNAVTYPTSPTFSDCFFLNNTAAGVGGGIFLFDDYAAMIRRCVFTGNSAITGGGVSCSDSDAHILKSTFYGNLATSQGSGIRSGGGAHPFVENTIVSYGTGGGAIICDTNSIPDFDCTDIYGNAGGDWNTTINGQLGVDGNINQDPIFCSPGTRDYTLRSDSPCAPASSGSCGQIGAKPVGCEAPSGPPEDLIDGVLIGHYESAIQFTTDPPPEGWGDHFLNNYAIEGCEEQNNELPFNEAVVWYVLAAWTDPKEWRGAEFGFGWYEGEAFEFVDWGPCFPGTGLDISGPDWPGPSSGTAILADEGAAWTGNYQPIYYFTGYTYDVFGPQVMELTPNPMTGFGGTYNAEDPPVAYEAMCLGGMGIGTPGIPCCPPPGPESYACCLPSGECLVLTEAGCEATGGISMTAFDNCDPNPCDYPDSRVCCVEGECHLVDSEVDCVMLDGVFYPEWDTCEPNQCPVAQDWADHTVGNCILTVTDQGILGFMDATQEEGSGFVFPADSSGANRLYLGSLWVGESPTYVANRDYAPDPEQEWIVSDNPDGHIQIDLGGTSYQDIHASYTDGAAASPLGLFVHQESWAYAANEVSENHVTLLYHVANLGDVDLTDLYVGCFVDADVGNYVENVGGTDLGRGLIYVTDSSGVHVGLRLLHDDEGQPLPANITLVRTSTHVWPNEYVLDADKHGFLSASGPEYILTEGPELDDYSMLASVGPVDLQAGEEKLFVFAILGAHNLEDLKTCADAAQRIYEYGVHDVPAEPDAIPAVTRLMGSRPNPFSRSTVIRFDLARSGDVKLGIHDVTGRLLRTLADGHHEARAYSLVWDGRDRSGIQVPGGVYFLRLRTGEEGQSRRVIRLR